MIPIELPDWVQPAVYTFLGLMALEIIVTVWKVINSRSLNQKLDEILSKVKMLMLQRRLEDEEYEPQYSEHPVPTDQMIRINKDY